MKKFFTYSFIAMAMTAMVLPISADTIDALTISNSGCHKHAPATRSDDEDVFGKPQWEISYQQGILTVTAYNVIANCCLESFQSSIDRVDESSLVFNVSEYFADEFALCDCICPFDVTSTFGLIEPGIYTIKLNSGYQSTDPVEVELKEGCHYLFAKEISGVETVAKSDEQLLVSKEGVLYVEASEDTVVEIFDSAGVRRFQLRTSEPTSVDIMTLPKGYYVVKATAGHKQPSTLTFIR